jgi:hypothetical protein
LGLPRLRQALATSLGSLGQKEERSRILGAFSEFRTLEFEICALASLTPMTASAEGMVSQ